MKKTLLCLLLHAISFTSFAQTYSVSGHVGNQQKEPVGFAAVSVNLAKDSTLVKADVADVQGEFRIAGIPDGKYFVRVTAVGQQLYQSPTFEVAGQDVSLAAILMQAEANQLNEVKVTGSKPLIEVKNDRMVFNVEASINATGSNALDLLQRSPGVQVDREENILVRGKTGVRIYIDGRPSPLAGKDLASTLKSMNSADIEAIEIITNPSAKFDAAGDLGIINIRLKKNAKLGTNGNVSLGGMFGITPKYNASLNLNHRDKKLNVFGNYGFNQGAWHNTTYDDQILNNVAYNKIWHGIWRDTTHSAKIGADYFINSKNTLGFSANGRISNHNGGGESETFISKRNNLMADSLLLSSRTSNPEKNKNLNLNVNYRYADTTGHELNIDADYGWFSSRGVSYQPNKYHFRTTSEEPLERNYVTETPVDITIRSFKVDYEQPFKKGKLGYGAKLSDVNSDNTFNFYNVLKNVEVIDTNRSNRFKYLERVYAAYINYNISLGKKWDLQAGIRAERTKSLGDLTSYKHNDLDKVDTTYLNFFPSGAISYRASKNHTWNLNYSRRINRPSYQNLNPFEYRVDELVYSKGNPFLKPEYANSFKLSHVYKGILTTSLGYRRTKFPVVGLRIPYDSSRTYFITENLDYSQGYSLDVSLTTPITKWWELNFNISGYHNLWKAALDNGLIVNNRTTAFNLNGQNTFKLKNNWTVELSGWYNSPYRRIDYNWQMGMVDVGVQKKFWKENASVKMTFSDVFHTARGGYTSAYAGIETRLRFRFEGQMLRVNFNYRFGSKEIKAARSRRSGSEDELNRIKG
ncbi:TonB-dependent receptor [Dyadobacter fermentans]|uniref:TonB-dependent receptor plug n=1 Tax=Dyadobacter fermentans (strain ATCC 700827 / DSM 18053 / CIP 107007 / KCTC 52180 / NS114) TaxID=471854 RepID=C6VYD7_DYAFD|nr:TonB-dependent receptor [Dyadobacter fermentans]ACT91616.1 TonB-dependent receptor plug [Dyadobacter fermentans DSM 18053]